MPTATTKSLTYNRPKASATAETTLQLTAEVSSGTNGNVIIDLFVTPQPTDPALVATASATITAGSTGDAYQINVSDGVGSYQGYYEQKAGDTNNTVAAALAADLSTSGVVKATATNNVVAIVAIMPGRDLGTVTNTGSTTPSNVVIATTNANVDNTTTFTKIKYGQLVISPTSTNFTEGQGDITKNGLPEIQASVAWYDTNGTTVLVQPSLAKILTTGPKSFDAFQTAAGVARE